MSTSTHKIHLAAEPTSGAGAASSMMIARLFWVIGCTSGQMRWRVILNTLEDRVHCFTLPGCHGSADAYAGTNGIQRMRSKVALASINGFMTMAAKIFEKLVLTPPKGGEPNCTTAYDHFGAPSSAPCEG